VQPDHDLKFVECKLSAQMRTNQIIPVDTQRYKISGIEETYKCRVCKQISGVNCSDPA